MSEAPTPSSSSPPLFPFTGSSVHRVRSPRARDYFADYYSGGVRARRYNGRSRNVAGLSHASLLSLRRLVILWKVRTQPPERATLFHGLVASIRFSRRRAVGKARAPTFSDVDDRTSLSEDESRSQVSTFRGESNVNLTERDFKNLAFVIYYKILTYAHARKHDTRFGAETLLFLFRRFKTEICNNIIIII